jgi:hypothetical protein
MVAMVDVSSSMCGNARITAIAMGIRIAEYSKLGERAMTFEPNPKWVKFMHQKSFVEKAHEMANASWGGSIDLYKAFELILEEIVDLPFQPKQIEPMSFVIFSDMEMEDCQPYHFQKFETLFPAIQKLYADKGIQVVGAPYSVPKLVFWNLRSRVVPRVSCPTENVCMISGYTEKMLQTFCEEGPSAFENYNNWSQFVESLDTPKYEALAKIVETNFTYIINIGK